MELDICYDFGIFHSDFRARSADDRDKAFWTNVRKRSACQCGTRAEEWDPTKGGNLAAYFPQTRICPGCIALQRTEEQIREQEGRGMSAYLMRNPDV